MINRSHQLFLSLGLLLLSAAPSQAKTTIRVGTQAPKGTVWMKAMKDIAKKVKKKTKGKVIFKFYPNGALGDEKVNINRMKTDEVEGGLFTGIGLGQILPKVRVLELPFLYRPGSGEVGLLREKLEAEMIEGFDRAGYVFLGWAEVGWAYLFSKVESANLEALRARKCWVWQDDPLAKKAFEIFGAKTVPLALTDVLTSLNAEMIDTVYNAPYGLIGLQWHTKVKFMSRVSVGHGVGALLITKRVFQRIPKKYRKIVVGICRKRGRKLVDEIAAENLKAEKELSAQGVKIIPVPKSDEKELAELGVKVARAMQGKLYPKELLDRVLKLLEEKRKADSGKKAAAGG